MKEILGLGDYGQKIMDITKKYLNTIWKKRKLNNKGQKHNKAEKQNIENFETERYGDHNYYKKTYGVINIYFFFIFYYLLVFCGVGHITKNSANVFSACHKRRLKETGRGDWESPPLYEFSSEIT